MSRPTVLLVDIGAAASFVQTLREILSSASQFTFQLSHWFVDQQSALGREDPLSFLATQGKPAALLLLISRRGIDAATTFVRQGARAQIPVVVVAEVCESEEISQLLQMGAADFITPPFGRAEILLRIQRLLGAGPAGHVSTHPPEPSMTHQLVGSNHLFLAVKNRIPVLAQWDVNVLICGETGTGKELFARSIHYESARHGRPFIPVNCGALPDHLFESELFGHTKGAYTDASTNAKGLVAEAEGGTIFLDEIDTLSPAAQVKLLRFLQNREYRVLGSPRTLRADVRIIAATNADLHQLVLNRSFRQDLYYRLKSISITIPPLRDRIEDIPSLADHFLKLLADRAKNRDLGISQGALEKMMAYCWPGNVRELEGVLQQAMLLAPAVTIEPYDIDLPETQDSRLTSACPLREAKNRAIQEFERSYLTTVLSSHRGNVSRAAKAAGKERRTFQRLLRKYGLQAKDFEGRSA